VLALGVAVLAAAMTATGVPEYVWDYASWLCGYAFEKPD
jgi:hypothetical protein